MHDGILVRLELVEQRRFDAGERMNAVLDLLKDDNFVAAFLEPDAGTVKRLLRPDIPVAAEIVAVDDDDALAPAAQIEKCVADLRKLKRAARDERRRVGGVAGNFQIRKPGRTAA